MATELEIDPNFLDFLKLLNQHEVLYVVIGRDGVEKGKSV